MSEAKDRLASVWGTESSGRVAQKQSQVVWRDFHQSLRVSTINLRARGGMHARACARVPDRMHAGLLRTHKTQRHTTRTSAHNTQTHAQTQARTSMSPSASTRTSTGASAKHKHKRKHKHTRPHSHLHTHPHLTRTRTRTPRTHRDNTPLFVSRQESDEEGPLPGTERNRIGAIPFIKNK